MSTTFFLTTISILSGSSYDADIYEVVYFYGKFD